MYMDITLVSEIGNEDTLYGVEIEDLTDEELGALVRNCARAVDAQ